MNTKLTPRAIIMFLAVSITTISITACGGTTDKTASVISRASTLSLDTRNTPVKSPANPQKTTSIATNWANDFESFTIDNETYLAVASLGVASKIYKFSKTTSSFTHIQSIVTYAASDFESFKINNETYLAVANGTNAHSKIYKFSRATNKFVEVQSILTGYIQDFESFTINNETYLVAAVFWNGSSYSTNSAIYKYHPSTKSFIYTQSIPTNGATSFESFKINNETYLSVSQGTKGAATIYKFSTRDHHFIPSRLIIDNSSFTHSFTINNENYLAVISGSTSTIYKYYAIINNFIPIQSISTLGAIDIESYTINNETYLAVANYYNGSFNTDSKIYKFSTSTNKFSHTQSIATHGAKDFESFKINNETYLAVANAHNGSTSNLYSNVYKLSPK